MNWLGSASNCNAKAAGSDIFFQPEKVATQLPDIMILLLLSYVGIVVGVVALVLTLTAGLYYLSEQVEEHTAIAKRLLVRLILVIMVVHLLLWLIDGFSFWRTFLGLAVNFVHLQTMRQFPAVKLSSPEFILSSVGALASHFAWFYYFSDPERPHYSIHEQIPHYQGKTHPPFREIASFYGICVWTVPFVLFITVSANENVLPYANPEQKPRQKRLVQQIVQQFWHLISQVSATLGYKITSPYESIV